MPSARSADDPEAWVADGWAAAPGAKRESRQVVPLTAEERKRRVPDAAALAAAARVTAALVVGARVQARFQASLGVPWKTYWFDGRIDGVNGDGTYNVRFDDGDFEPNVKRRFVRLARRKPAAAAATAVPPPLNAVATTTTMAGGVDDDGDGVDEEEDEAYEYEEAHKEEEQAEDADPATVDRELYDLGMSDIHAFVTDAW